MPLHLRPARTTDLPAIAALMNRAFRGVGQDASWNSEAALIDGDRTTPALLAADLATRPRGHLLVVDGPATPQGCVWLEPLATESHRQNPVPAPQPADPADHKPSVNTWYLGSLTVDPAIQNTGLGRDLLHVAEQWAVARGAQRIRMTVVNQRDTLIAWYKRRGYHLTGERQPFPYNDTRFGTPRRPDLAFVVLERFVASTQRLQTSLRHPAQGTFRAP